MPEPFKNKFNEKIIIGMAKHFQAHWSEFDVQGFSDKASKELSSLELKERSEQIMYAMVEYLPKDFTKASEIILGSLSPTQDDDIFGLTVDDNGIAGWAIMPIAHYVGLQGSDDFSLSMVLLKELTKRFSSEFGIRFFLLKDPEKTMMVMKEWATNSSRHVRRLASEGVRPRLPWAMQLPFFIENPKLIIELLEVLKDDKDEYVRRSVANNLNDIAKDNPDIVIGIADKWMQGASKERVKLIRHACRTLLKQGNKRVLKVFGYETPNVKQTSLDVQSPIVLFGTALQFTFSITSNSKKEQLLMIDYVIHHQKANGKTSPKIFKWRIKNLIANNSFELAKQHTIKKISTRKYYQGLHTIEVVVNGVIMGKANFHLEMPEQNT